VETPVGLFVGAVWPTLSTGVSAARHGRYCFAQLEPGTYEVHRVGGTVVEYEPFWVTAARRGRRTAAIDIPHSDVDPALDVHVVDWSRHDPNVGFRTWPPELADDLVEQYGRQADDTCNAYARRGALGELRDEMLASIRRKTDYIEAALAAGSWDLFTATFGESHCAGHQFWALHDPCHPQHDAERATALGDPLVEIYAALDRAVAQIVDGAGSDSLILLLLSHGMGPHYDATKLLPEMLRRADVEAGRSHVLAARERARRASRRVRRHGRRREEFVSAVDGSARWFAVPNNDACGAVRVNLLGREPHGRVQGGAAFDAACRQIEDALCDWNNLDTGEPVVRAVVRTDAHYDGPARDHLPDLLVEWNRSAPIDSVVSRRYGRIDRESTSVRTGDHRPGGLLVSAGPSAPSSESMRAVDFAPTILSALEIPVADLDGRALAS
jgi:predicted AlkP superfamily phosphohydrolase/phosphomutase